VTAGAGLNLDYLVEDRRIEFADVRLAGAPGVSMGGLFLDHSLEGYFRLRSGGAVGGEGYTFDTGYTMTGGAAWVSNQWQRSVSRRCHHEF